MSLGLWIALVAVVAALAFGLYRKLTDGTFRGTRAVRGVAGSAPGVLSGATSIFSGLPSEMSESSEKTSTPESTPGADPAASWARVLGEGFTFGERATLVQFSSAFCAPCRATRVTLGKVSTQVSGVVHVEIDAEQHLDVVRALGIMRTPTTLVLNAAGEEITRASGAPRLEQVLGALPTS